MEYYQVNFDVLENLLKSSTKELIEEGFMACCKRDEDLVEMKADYLPSVFTTISKELEMTNEDTATVSISQFSRLFCLYLSQGLNFSYR